MLDYLRRKILMTLCSPTGKGSSPAIEKKGKMPIALAHPTTLLALK